MFTPINDNQIVIGFSTARAKFSPVAFLIRLLERRPYSHCYTRFKDWGRDVVFQSNFDDINFGNWSYFNVRNIVIEEYVFDVTDEVKEKVLQTCVDRLHLKYGALQLIGMGLIRVWKNWTGKKLPNPWRDGEKTQVCSELCSYVLAEMGYDLDPEQMEIQGPRWLNDNIQGWLEQGLCRKL